MTLIRLLFALILVIIGFECGEYVRYGDDPRKVDNAKILVFACFFAAGVLVHFALL